MNILLPQLVRITDRHLRYTNGIYVYFVIKWNTGRERMVRNTLDKNHERVKCLIGESNVGELTEIKLAVMRCHVEKRGVREQLWNDVKRYNFYNFYKYIVTSLTFPPVLWKSMGQYL